MNEVILTNEIAFRTISYIKRLYNYYHISIINIFYSNIGFQTKQNYEKQSFEGTESY